ncbi:MAG: tRNA (adenosine(37)-N6)-threonylcarbamoyltransferase complex ATPase subunit type 1 TsaE [Oscillospiraceae bacterium]|jgi:tRNA threonylcarbamoyladenosine biosynthesis protein TsaE|nr:tRNA (adenosine(37)-N6)-threonylcarbamoyltransferase complex ATPase subunit type 1 TsaE [Oscillospiraceae bacterium]
MNGEKIDVISKSVEETESIGEKLAKQLSGNETIALYGGLGMGKTAFVRGLVKGLGYKGDVTSPTFALMHEYIGKFYIYHFDMYRVNNFEDLASTGFYDYIEKGIVVIEWSENIKNELPADAFQIIFKQTSNSSERAITIYKNQTA